ncbi:MAG: hypothetical protein ACK4IY_06410, partial [Chitinophagales bacterium]
MSDKKKVLIISDPNSAFGEIVKQYLQAFGLGLFAVDIYGKNSESSGVTHPHVHSQSFDYIITPNAKVDLPAFGNAPIIFKMPAKKN